MDKSEMINSISWFECEVQETWSLAAAKLNMSQQHCSSMQFTAKHTAKIILPQFMYVRNQKHPLTETCFFFPGFEIQISTVHWEGFLVFQIFSWQTLPGRPGLGDCKMPPFITTWHHHRFGAPFTPKKGRNQEIYFQTQGILETRKSS